MLTSSPMPVGPLFTVVAVRRMTDGEAQMMRDELLNQLKSQDLETVAPSAFRQVGNPVFPDSSALGSLIDFGFVVEAFRHVHFTAYGQPIPKTAAVGTSTNDGDVCTAVGNQILKVQAIEIVNSGPDPVDGVEITLNGVLVASVLATGNETTVLALSYPLYVDSNGPLAVANSSAAITVNATYVLTSQ